MKVQCSTCLELLIPGDDLTSTPCGHVFHLACVLQWLETKQNCPQCRQPAKEWKLRKIFLAEPDGGQEDPKALRNELENVQFQLRLKETEKSKLYKRNKELEDSLRQLKDELKKLKLDTSVSVQNKLENMLKNVHYQLRLKETEKTKVSERNKKLEDLSRKQEDEIKKLKLDTSASVRVQIKLQNKLENAHNQLRFKEMEKSKLYERIKELKDLSRQQKDELRKLRLVTSVSVNVLLVVILASIGFFTRQDSWFSGITHFLIIFIQVLLNYLFALSLYRTLHRYHLQPLDDC